VLRLIAGYSDKSGSTYPAAISNEAGCILVQKKPNRLVSAACNLPGQISAADCSPPL
jgi:ABC-type Fe2+-enterobactin transport system substrate-binding protein